MECTVKSKKADRMITVDYDFGQDINEFIELFGEVAAHNHAVASAKLSINSLVRPMLEATEEDGEFTYDADAIRDAVASYKLPDKTGRQVDKGAKAMELLNSLSPEKRAEILAALAG